MHNCCMLKVSCIQADLDCSFQSYLDCESFCQIAVAPTSETQSGNISQHRVDAVAYTCSFHPYIRSESRNRTSTSEN